MTRDRDRARVYAAERLVFDETLFAEPLGAAGMVELAAAINADAWWLTNGTAFEVVPARRESGYSSARPGTADRIPQVRLTLHQEDAATLTHEVAHLLATGHGATSAHGQVFRTAAVDVTAVVCGTIASRRLHRCFTDAGLPLADRPWRPPTSLTDRGLYGRWRLTRQTAN